MSSGVVFKYEGSYRCPDPTMYKVYEDQDARDKLFEEFGNIMMRFSLKYLNVDAKEKKLHGTRIDGFNIGTARLNPELVRQVLQALSKTGVNGIEVQLVPLQVAPMKSSRSDN